LQGYNASIRRPTVVATTNELLLNPNGGDRRPTHQVTQFRANGGSIRIFAQINIGVPVSSNKTAHKKALN
jgi:hypothetical protein